MMKHPENPEQINNLIDFIEKSQTCLVWCKGCEMDRPMNIKYLKYIKDAKIEGCRFCRDYKVSE
jgi:hypothetical protein